ncbi:MAG: glutamate--tRNA ligase family protein [archaeon]|nr:glutamate--tRNA ligase family protein [archaeon]
MVKINDEVIKAYALKNAVEHGGKAVMGSVISGLFIEGLKKEEIKDYTMKLSFIINEVNKMSPELQKVEYEEINKKVKHREVRDPSELPELPGAKKGKVIMRYRPAPSGPMHIGHAISQVIGSLFVKKYGGKFYVFIDDTNPEETLKEAYKNLKEDCDWLFGNVYEYVNASDRMEVYYKYAKELIEKKFAYVCTCKSEKFKKLADTQKPCPCRDLSVKDNTERWEKMLDKKGYKQGEAVLRFKSDLKNPNPAMRDFPLARINESKHPLQGNKYRVWPLMNLSVTCDDIDYEMTHVIRGKDHRDNAERQKMIFKALGKEKQFPWTFFIGRVKFTDLILSKRKIKAAIEKGEFEGSDDIRLPTIASLRKRNYKPESFAKLATMRGLTEVDKVMSQKDLFDVLDRFNK